MSTDSKQIPKLPFVWKILIILALLISIVSICLIALSSMDLESLYPSPPQYITQILYLNNTNTIHYDVVDYICDEGMYVHHIDSHFLEGYFYASTWEGDSHGAEITIREGKCMIKKEI